MDKIKKSDPLAFYFTAPLLIRVLHVIHPMHQMLAGDKFAKGEVAGLKGKSVKAKSKKGGKGSEEDSKACAIS